MILYDVVVINVNSPGLFQGAKALEEFIESIRVSMTFILKTTESLHKTNTASFFINKYFKKCSSVPNKLI